MDRQVFEAAWREWQAFLGQHWTVRGRNVDVVGARLRRFERGDFETAAEIERAMSDIARGVMLCQACDRWERPAVGPSSPTATDLVRGTQWRLVIGHAAWESFARGISREGTPHYRCWSCIPHPYLLALGPPEASSDSELSRWSTSGGRVGIDAYFGLEERPWRRVEGWLVGKQEITQHEDLLGLAAAFRHATAHGMLSATKTWEWGLAPAFEVLTAYLLATVSAGVVVLAEP